MAHEIAAFTSGIAAFTSGIDGHCSVVQMPNLV
jgi:hypothetical protein